LRNRSSKAYRLCGKSPSVHKGRKAKGSRW
jgi:hypothetical protein